MTNIKNQQAIIKESKALFADKFGSDDLGDRDAHVGWAPGRVNLIGEYTDLNQGYVLPMAIDQGICVVLRLRAEPGLSVYAHAFESSRVIAMPDELPSSAAQSPDWATFVLGAAQLCRRAGCAFQGFDAVIHSNLSSSGGVSSSAALTTAISMAIQSATNQFLEPLANAQLCQRVEHDYLGVMCGLMDQMACRMGRSQHALFVDCATNESENVPFPAERAQLLIVNSGVSRTLYSSEYNARRLECGQAVEAIRGLGYELSSLRDVSAALVERLAPQLDATLLRRVRHVVSENARVLAAKSYLVDGQLPLFGESMFASHASLRDDFEVSVAELDEIVDIAKDCEGVLGARLTGAGFGGNAIVLLQPEHAATVADAICQRFAARFGSQPQTHLVGVATEASGAQSPAM